VGEKRYLVGAFWWVILHAGILLHKAIMIANLCVYRSRLHAEIRAGTVDHVPRAVINSGGVRNARDRFALIASLIQKKSAAASGHYPCILKKHPNASVPDYLAQGTFYPDN